MAPETPQRILERLDMPARVLGFEPAPPCRVYVKTLRAWDHATLFLLCDPDRPPMLAQWLGGYGPRSVTIGPGVAPRVLRAEFATLPERWSWMKEDIEVQSVTLFPAGLASVYVLDTAERAAAFAENIRRRATAHGEVRMRAVPRLFSLDDRSITPRQRELLAVAVSLGYYDVPHGVDLRAMAKMTGISAGAISAVLRRAESIIISSYIDSLAEQEWERVRDEFEGLLAKAPQDTKGPRPGPRDG